MRTERVVVSPYDESWIIEFAKIKEEIEAARLYPDDIDGYINYKSPCIAELYKACGIK